MQAIFLSQEIAASTIGGLLPLFLECENIRQPVDIDNKLSRIIFRLINRCAVMDAD